MTNNKVNSTILIFKGYGGANGQKTADLGDELQSVKHTAKLLIIVLFIFYDSERIVDLFYAKKRLEKIKKKEN